MEQPGDTTASVPTAPFHSLSVIVPVYNRAHLIGACLEHLLRAAGPVVEAGTEVEIVVADDASTDGSGAQVEAVAARSPLVPIRKVALPHRQGPGRARNAALEASGGELVVFVDSDIMVVPAFLQAHLDAYRGAVAGYTVGIVVSVPDLEAALAYPAPTQWDLSNASLHTANASVPRKQLEAVGFFDAGFEAYGWEDLDLGRRLKKAGLARVVVQEAVGYHVDPPIATPAQLQARIQKERERGRYALHFLRKHPEYSARLTAQDTALHRGLNWLFRLGGLVREENLLGWVRWARRHRLRALEEMWMAGVLNQVYLESLGMAKKEQARRPVP